MKVLSESGSTFSKTVIILSCIGMLAAYGIYWAQKALDNIYADDIINSVWEKAKEEKKRIDPIDTEEEEEEDDGRSYSRQIERKGFGFSIAEGSTHALIKVNTEKKAITPGICRALKKKFKESMWWDAFTKVVVVDRMGDEKTDVLIYDCPHEKIPTLRFYAKFADTQEPETEEAQEEEITSSGPALPPPVSVPAPSSAPTRRVPAPSYTRLAQTTCPSGTSANGRGGIATTRCRCNLVGESWNGRSCEMKACPEGSSRNVTNRGERTNVSGCVCNNGTPVWLALKDVCVANCPDGRVLDRATGACLSNKNNQDCRWGVCQTCEGNGIRQNINKNQVCQVAGLNGLCNGNGTCYPTEGRKCSSVRGCPNGEFCNYGGNYNSTKKQIGKFGQTPNVCQMVNAEEFTYKKVTYYYNSEEDLKAWCRAANNKPNCLWGYLSKSGAISWCTSLGKRLLTKAEMASVWNELKKELPQTYKGYAYWVEEGVWIEDFKGRRSFGNSHPDGYGGRGGVVCR